jgi:hypothetical protein
VAQWRRFSNTESGGSHGKEIRTIEEDGGPQGRCQEQEIVDDEQPEVGIAFDEARWRPDGAQGRRPQDRGSKDGQAGRSQSGRSQDGCSQERAA